MNEYFCHKCRKLLPEEAFYHNRQGRIKAMCKQCRRNYNNQWKRCVIGTERISYEPVLSLEKLGNLCKVRDQFRRTTCEYND